VGFPSNGEKTGKIKKGNGKKNTQMETSSTEKETVPYGEKQKWDFCGADGETKPL
jgi:hypothetical protein